MILTDLCVIKQKIKKKHFYKCCLQCFSSEKILIKHKENCLKINGKQSMKLKSGSIKFKNHVKQLAVLFKIYAEFQSLLKGVKSSNKNNISFFSTVIFSLLCFFISAFNIF